MTENTEKKVKSWSRDSLHKTYEAATARRDKLTTDAGDEASDPDADFDTKIRLQRGLYVLQTWRGKMKAAPAPKAKPQQEISL